MRKVAIISKPGKAELATLLPELMAWLRERELEPVLDLASGQYVGAVEVHDRMTMHELHPELVVVLGGDGTLLSAARAFAKTDVPVLSVNLGSLGFLTEVPLGDLYKTLEGWLAGTCLIDTRWMMHAELCRGGKLLREWEALNDVVVSKGAIARMGDFTIMLDGQFVARFRADGVIVATPTGSTAYSLAANGPILMPSVDAMVVTPVCPHLLTIRPIVMPGGVAVSVHVEGIPDISYLTVDGQEAVEMQVGDVVNCRRSDYFVKLLRLTENGLFNVLRSKLKWGER